MKEKKSKKPIIIIICIAVAVAAIAGVLIFVLGKEDSYRLLKVFEVEGTASVTREGTGTIDPYTNMVLESGDHVALDTGKFTIKADEDKYIYLEDHTELVLVASGTSSNSKTKIELLSGAITNDIQKKLSVDSSYEVNTPNSTMSVLGTVFRVSVYEENGVKYTKIVVFSGKVKTNLVYDDGSVSDEEVVVEEGKQTIIYYDGTKTDYVSDPTDIDYQELTDEALQLLASLAEEGREIDITKEEVDHILNGPYEVVFKYKGVEFGRQTVKKGEKAQVPNLQPEASGSWKFDFSQPINRDTEINWE